MFKVMGWLVASGISEERLSLSANKQWIQFDAHAKEAEDLLFADFYVFESTGTGSKNVGVSEYHLPQDVQEHVGECAASSCCVAIAGP